MTYKTAFEAEMRKYRQEQVVSNIACSLTPRQLNASIEQIDNTKNRRRRTSDATKPKKPPIFLRRWFLTLIVASTGAVYAMEAGYVRAMKNIGDNVKATTGIDILSVDTYKELAKPPPKVVDGNLIQNNTAQPENTSSAPAPIVIHRDYSVNAEALGSDLSKIQIEAEKLEIMAREFDQQFRK